MKLDSVGERLRYALSDLKISQKDLAIKCNLSKNYISMIVTNQYLPSGRVIDQICEELQLSKEWLIDGKGEMYAPSPQIQEIAELIDKLLTWKPDEFRTQFINQLANLPLEHWHFIEEFVDNLQTKKEADEE